MKTVSSIIMCIVFFSFTIAVKGQTKQNKKEVEIKIKTSAVCGTCKTNIEKALAFEKGVKKSNLDVENKIVTVIYNPTKTNPDKIRLAINKSGYDADDKPADKKAFDQLDECCKKPHK